MKLDVSMLRYLGKDEMRVLSAIEQLMRNHESVPVEMIPRIANLKRGIAMRALREVHKHKLVFHENVSYDAYRLTFSGYDYLALKALVNQNVVCAVGNKIGVGKESDIYVAIDDDGEEICLKFHRLGRTSFRTVKKNRDYLRHRKSASWMYLSRLAALKEFSFMQALYNVGFPVPRPIRVNRHVVVMELVDGVPLTQVKHLEHASSVFQRLMELILDLASYGLIHCDFNEFNIMINDTGDVLTVIDFPQTVSISHANAQSLFERDVNCIRNFFSRRYNYEANDWPRWERDVILAGSDNDDGGGESSHGGGENAQRESRSSALKGRVRLDIQVEASGFNKQEQQELDDITNEESEDTEEEEEEKEDEEQSEEQRPAEQNEEGEEEIEHAEQVSREPRTKANIAKKLQGKKKVRHKFKSKRNREKGKRDLLEY